MSFENHFSGGGGGGAKDDVPSPSKQLRPSTSRSVLLTLRDGVKLEISQEVTRLVPFFVKVLGFTDTSGAENGSDSEEEEDDTQIEITLPNINSTTMTDVVTYVQRHQLSNAYEIPKPLPSAELSDFIPDSDDIQLASLHANEDVQTFVRRMADLGDAAHFLDIESLRQLVCAALAVRIYGKNETDALEAMGLDPNEPFTQEDEQRVLAENPWLVTDV